MIRSSWATLIAMPATTRTFGLILIVLGLASYFLTGRVSVTALIPAFFGSVFIILALVARNESARKHAMHAAVALGCSDFSARCASSPLWAVASSIGRLCSPSSR